MLPPSGPVVDPDGMGYVGGHRNANGPVRSFIFLFVSGIAFFSGAFSILASVALSFARASKWRRMAARTLLFTGIAFIVCSSTPIPNWLYAMGGPAMAFWLFSARLPDVLARRTSVAARGVLAGVVLVSVVMEWPWHRAPPPPAPFATLHVIGDSMSAGLGARGEITWPVLLQLDHGMSVTNLAQPGATLASALKQAAQIREKKPTVLVEVGGNDLLSSTPTVEFERDLRALLDALDAKEATVVMMELPLPPFHNAYGAIQRRLATEHRAILLPKGLFAGVLFSKDGTSDSLHLSQEGHQRMADMVWRNVGHGKLTQDRLGDAAACGDVELVKECLDRGISLNGKDRFGWSPFERTLQGNFDSWWSLMEASGFSKQERIDRMDECSRRRQEVMDLLLARGLNVDVRDEHGRTALIRAAGCNHVGVLEILLEKGADVNARDRDDNTALICAAGVPPMTAFCGEPACNIEAMYFLLKHGADVNARNKNGATALMAALNIGMHRWDRGVELLIARGADVNAATSNGTTALKLAQRGTGGWKREEYVGIERLLRKSGAKE